jgi:hypothetical protein
MRWQPAGRWQDREDSITCIYLLKQSPLVAPVDPADDGPQISFVQTFDQRQEKNLLLNI